jgi:SAM-dependent methyltransferase
MDTMSDLLGFDWRSAWMAREDERVPPANRQEWDERSKDFAKKAGNSPYAASFLDFLGLGQKCSILDMGCGPGTLALPLARMGHSVTAADFSPKMLAKLQERASGEGLPIPTVLMDINEDWTAAGIGPKSFDVVIMSRSIMTVDLWAVLERLDSTARSKAAFTIATEYGPRGTSHVGDATESGAPFVPDYLFAAGMLLRMNLYPELRYIDSWREDDASVDGRRLVRWAYFSWQPRDSKTA